jgi:NhaP-type Na+/H+ or K+/H+ antiporter
LNDGAAFPAVLLALALISDVPNIAGWLALDLAWAIAAGISLGALCGVVLAFAVEHLRRSGAPLEFEEFLAFGLIAISYGTALAIHAYGFVAVFVAGLAFAHAERKASDSAARPPASAETANRLLAFTSRCERLAEVGLVLLIGAALWSVTWSIELIVFAAALILLIRPLATALTIRRKELSTARRRMLAWFGIRGIGSIYYVTFALGTAVDARWSNELASATLATVAISIGVHGVSATPLMSWLRRSRGRGARSSDTDQRR